MQLCPQLASAARTMGKVGADPLADLTLSSWRLKQGRRLCLGMLHPASPFKPQEATA